MSWLIRFRRLLRKRVKGIRWDKQEVFINNFWQQNTKNRWWILMVAVRKYWQLPRYYGIAQGIYVAPQTFWMRTFERVIQEEAVDCFLYHISGWYFCRVAAPPRRWRSSLLNWSTFWTLLYNARCCRFNRCVKSLCIVFQLMEILRGFWICH